jgi:hypothetical protein
LDFSIGVIEISQHVGTALERTISRERLAKYLTASEGDILGAIAIYQENTLLSEAFYTPLQCVEIALRNVLNEGMAARYGDDWLKNGRAPLDSDALTTIAKLRIGPNDSTGTIVAELSFGFWVSLLGPRYDATLWRDALCKVVRPSKGSRRRKDIHARFNAIRRLRNRVAHHEPIFQKDLAACHAEIIEAISWLCAETAQWSERISRVPGLLTR